MKIYIASCNQNVARSVADCLLKEGGFEIVSTWIYKEFSRTADLTVEERIEIATRDTKEVCSADALVLCSGIQHFAGGKHVEAGIAIGRGIPVIIYGHIENMLYWNPDVECYSNMGEVLLSLIAKKHAKYDYVSEHFTRG